MDIPITARLSTEVLNGDTLYSVEYYRGDVLLNKIPVSPLVYHDGHFTAMTPDEYLKKAQGIVDECNKPEVVIVDDDIAFEWGLSNIIGRMRLK